MGFRASAVSLTLLATLSRAPVAAAQNAPARLSATDSAIIARELAAWDALQKNDSGAAFSRIVGNTPTWIIVTPGGIRRQPAAEVGRMITVDCDRRGNAIDSAHVDHITSDVVLLSYKVTLDSRCGSDSTWSTTPYYSLTVWARRGGRWQLVAQGMAPQTRSR